MHDYILLTVTYTESKWFKLTVKKKIKNSNLRSILKKLYYPTYMHDSMVFTVTCTLVHTKKG